MTKTQKELAFLRDLYVQNEWTQRFTDLVDKHIDLTDSGNLLYLNAGTGTHALALDERFGAKTDIFAACENEDLLAIARDKAAAVGAGVDFSQLKFEADAFDSVLADASLIRPTDLEAFVADAVRVARTGAIVAVFLPAAGSFGEVFSLLWEILYRDGLGEHGAVAERMLTEMPTTSRVESIAKNGGLVNVRTANANEIFEYENGAEFIASPLVADHLLPAWLEGLSENEKERVAEELAQLIDIEDGTMPFRFSVKVTLLTGEKI